MGLKSTCPTFPAGVGLQLLGLQTEGLSLFWAKLDFESKN